MKKFEVKFYRKIYTIIFRPVLARIFICLPIDKKKIVFDNFGGKGYGDNPKYIAEEIKNRKLNFDMVWLIDNCSDIKMPSGIRTVKIDSVRGLYEKATAKIWIDNVRHLHPIKKKENQIYLQTWHAPFSPKCVEKDAENNLSKEYVSEAKYDGSITDAILANSKLQEIQYKRAFWLNDKCEILKVGLPRNDYLANAKYNSVLKVELRNKIGLKNEWYYILYAPTFRDDYSLEGYQLEFDRIIDAFEKLVKKKCALIVRLHPNAATQSSFIKYGDTIINGTVYPDIQELSVATDCVISDYSTSIFDFALLNKPVFVCALDLKDYMCKRGLLKEFTEFPFPLAETNDELISFINNFDRAEYDQKVNAFFEKYPVYDKGNAAKKTVDWIIERIKE